MANEAMERMYQLFTRAEPPAPFEPFVFVRVPLEIAPTLVDQAPQLLTPKPASPADLERFRKALEEYREKARIQANDQ